MLAGSIDLTHAQTALTLLSIMSSSGDNVGHQFGSETKDEPDSSVSSPEYRTLCRSYSKVVDVVKVQQAAIWDDLFTRGYIPSSVRQYTINDGITDEMKTHRVLDALLAKVKVNPNAYHGFREVLKSDSPWGDDIVGLLDKYYQDELANDQSRTTEMGKQGDSKEGIKSQLLYSLDP